MEKEDKTSYKIIQPLLLSACMAVGMMVGFKLNDKSENALVSITDYPLDSMMMTGRVEELVRFIEGKYVDKIDSDLLLQTALDAIFNKLDPHSVYLSPKEVEEVNDQMNGSYNGIGIENFIIDDTVNISSVLYDSPAEKAGLKVFDKVISINDHVVAGSSLEYNEIRELFNLEKGAEIKIGILRDQKLLLYDVKVDEVPVRTITAELLPEMKTVLIKIDRFGSNTYKEFMEEVEKYFDTKQAKHIIIDLRNNPGGYLPEATNILCQIFEEKDKLLLYTTGRNNKKNEYKSNGKRFFEIDQVAVLIDENSASASEIIAGAIQDWDRGVIIGRRSYGKGLVQEQYNLTNGGAIRLTVARYFTPSGRSIQRDYTDRNSYEEDFGERYQNGDFFHKDSTLIKNGGKFYTQILHREVSALGGITPDIFVPLDTVYKDENIFNLISFIPEYTFRYVSKNKKDLPENISDFKEWHIPDYIYSDFKDYIGKSIQNKSFVNAFDTRKLEKELKSYIAGYLFDKKMYMTYEMQKDEFVSEAIRYIKDNKTSTNTK